MGAILHVLASPDRAFREEPTYRVSRALLILLLFLSHATGSELVARFYSTPYVLGLTVQQQANEAARFAFGPPPGGGGPANANSQRPRGAGAPPGAAIQAVGVVIQSTIFVLLSMAVWWLLIIFVQFLGGEERKTDTGPHRNSRYLLTYAWLPLAFRRLTEGILINLQDPSAAWSALNLAQYRKASEISFSPLSLAQLPRIPDPLSYLLYSLTDPFYLWFLFLIVYGGREVFHLSVRTSLVQGGFVILLLYLLRTGLSAVGIHTGV